MPALWASGRLTLVQQQELLRALLRRVIRSRPAADRGAGKVVWVSGAISLLTACPPIWRTTDLADYDRSVARVRELCAPGYQDEAITDRLTTEGFHGPRSAAAPARMVFKLRQALGLPSLTEQVRRPAMVDGHWTVWGLARQLGVDRAWRSRRLYRGTLPPQRRPPTGHHLIPDDPVLRARLRAAVAAHPGDAAPMTRPLAPGRPQPEAGPAPPSTNDNVTVTLSALGPGIDPATREGAAPERL